MQTIRFSHFYKKMPPMVELLDTSIKDIAVINYKDLTSEEIIKDTETVDGKFYFLPKTKLIWIKLWSITINGGFEWGTMRMYTNQKFLYYKSLIGKRVNIQILEGGAKSGKSKT